MGNNCIWSSMPYFLSSNWPSNIIFLFLTSFLKRLKNMHVLFLLLLYYVVLDYYCHFSLCRSKNCLFLSLPTEHKNNICPSLFMVFPPKIGKFDMMCQLSHVTTTSTNSKVGKNRNTYVKIISTFICNNL